MNFSRYDRGDFYDEMISTSGEPHPASRLLAREIEGLPQGELKLRQKSAERALMQAGITFNVYSDNRGVEKTLPFDLIPRIVSGTEWTRLEKGLQQRIQALNLFLDDLYHDQKILKDGIIPREVIASSKGFREQCVGLKPPQGIWCHVTGTDLVRDRTGQILVLEDNLRCPSGVSYVLENRRLMKSLFPEVFSGARIKPVSNYPARLRDMLEFIAPDGGTQPRVVVLTPGRYNSAYFEHSFLAQQMGVELVEGSDLVVHEGFVWMRTTNGFERVDVIYRRIDDDFLDPRAFRPDSMLGVPGLMDVYKAGNVALANAPGTGVADDKAVYAYIPRVIRYYLGEEAIIPNVTTYICSEEQDLRYVLENLGDLVVKAANESGGYGMLIGPRVPGADRGVPAPGDRQPAQLHRPAHAVALQGAHHLRDDPRGAARGSPALHPLRPRHLRAARRPHAGGPAQGFPGGELLPGRRHQGHLGARRDRGCHGRRRRGSRWRAASFHGAGLAAGAPLIPHARPSRRSHPRTTNP